MPERQKQSGISRGNLRGKEQKNDFEEQLYDTKLPGQTFRHPTSQSSDDTSTSLSRSPVSLNNKRPDFIFLPATKQLYDDETSSSVGNTSAITGPPVADKPRWPPGRRPPGQFIALDVTGDWHSTLICSNYPFKEQDSYMLSC
ncbi:hypothetical protein JOQ06_020975 [Pogonophryne albipinna]|uniref:Uncharacterized protein n=1 Tax=Pogonophryne albipinna TaxID=1090488 RepID=A0AAD6FV15_9TELE|nr:hypothetical protein JOQ06_020975 [Pogonophryne albipinna]